MVSDLNIFVWKLSKIAAQKKFVFYAGFLGILGLPYCGIGATIRIGREMLCLPYAGFLLKNMRSNQKCIQTMYLELQSLSKYELAFFCK